MLNFQFLMLTAAEVWRGISSKVICQFLFNLIGKKLVKGSLKVWYLTGHSKKSGHRFHMLWKLWLKKAKG